jgi:uncharacterized protein DUF3489
MAIQSKAAQSTDKGTERPALVAGRTLTAQKTKKARLKALLCRKRGIGLDALQQEFGWQPHTVRAAISGVRKAGDTMVCVAGKSGPVYRIVKELAAQ